MEVVGLIGGIYTQSLYFNNYPYRNTVRSTDQAGSAEAAGRTEQAQAAGRTGKVVAVSRAANPGVPVEPVDPVPAVSNEASSGIGRMLPFMRQGADPVEMAVRMRIQQYDPSQESAQAAKAGAEGGQSVIPGAKSGTEGQQSAIPGQETVPEGDEAGIEGVMKTVEEGECQTCEERKYQDGSDDPGVSFKTASHIAPEQAASAVKGHEMEHVVREQAKAEREDRRVVSQNVSIHTDICPECGKVYVSGGTTRTVTAANPQPEQSGQTANDMYKPFFAVA